MVTQAFWRQDIDEPPIKVLEDVCRDSMTVIKLRRNPREFQIRKVLGKVCMHALLTVNGKKKKGQD